MNTDYERYCRAIEELASLSARAESEREEVEHTATARVSRLDREWRTARAELDQLSDKRNRVQRDVVALCRQVGPDPTAATAPPPRQLVDIRAVASAIDDVSRRTERAQRDWQWAQRYLERAQASARVAPSPPPAPTISTPVTPPRAGPTRGDSRLALIVGAGVLVLIVIIILLVAL